MESIKSEKHSGYYYASTWHELFGFICGRSKIKDLSGTIEDTDKAIAKACSEANSEAIAICHNKARILMNTLPLIKA